MNENNSRRPVASGSFYPANQRALYLELEKLFSSVKGKESDRIIRSLILPHAGIHYSGLVAASAVARLNRNREIKRIFLLGCTHSYSFQGAAVFTGSEFVTPLGHISVDQQLGKELAADKPFFESFRAHEKDHCLEVLLPYFQYWLDSPFQIVPILLGEIEADEISRIALTLRSYVSSEDLMVVSSDLSHYPNYDDALLYDRITIDSILSGSRTHFVETLEHNKKMNFLLDTSCCGSKSIEVLLDWFKQTTDVRIEEVLYKNSGDFDQGLKDRVVGYSSFLIAETDPIFPFTWDEGEKKELLNLARETMEQKIRFNRVIESVHLAFDDYLGFGCFVSIYIKGELRGCLGRFPNDESLYDLLVQLSASICSNDTRFLPLKYEELKEATIELSILSPLEEVVENHDIQIGTHGILLKKDGIEGVFLPQVAVEENWTPEEFIANCAKYKLNMLPFSLDQFDIFRFEAYTLSE